MVELTPENRNIESAAQEILAEIAALATKVENGLEKLREMGLVDSIGEGKRIPKSAMIFLFRFCQTNSSRHGR